MDAETEWQLDQALINSLTVDQVNQAYSQMVRPNENLVILVRSPKRDGIDIVTEEEIKSIIADIETESIEPYTDNTVIEPLIDPSIALKGSKAKVTDVNESLGYTEWTLKNGVKVVVRPSALKADEVQIVAIAKGGKSMLSIEESLQADYLAMVMQQSGIGNFSALGQHHLCRSSKRQGSSYNQQ